VASRTADARQLQYETNLNLAECYNNIGKSNLAYIYQDTAIQFRDSIFKVAALNTKAFYNVKTDLAKVASEMESLKQKEKKQRISFIFFILLLSLAIVFTLIVYKLQHSKNKVLRELVKKNLEIIEDERKLSANLQQQIPIKKATRKTAENEKSESLYFNLTCWLEAEKRFAQKDLSLELVARELNTNREYLSRAINDKQIRFNDLINKYRVQEAIQILTDTSNKNGQFKLSYISSKVGFNSNSAFIDAFKKQTGLNPAEFRKNITIPE
jgi:AraC-like DNA-binding protein